MDICNELTYDSYLLNLLDNYAHLDDINSQLRINIYITLMALSGGIYNKNNEQNKIDIIEDFARKVNNLKVKIQLKRKEEEINKLIDDIKKIYDENNKLIDKYNIDKLNIIEILDGKEPKEITKIIDIITKEKMRRLDNKIMYDNLRSSVINNIFDNNYHIMDNTLYINISDIDDIVISLDIFYQVFDYLLDIDNYKDIFNKNNVNKNHKILIENIIKLLNEKHIDNVDILIPIILTHIFVKIENDDTLDMSKFKIDNIKITDLYKLAEQSKGLDSAKCVMWRKIIIPNTYLIDRISNIIKNGTYYFQDDTFVMDDIVNNISDFKISINKEDIINLTREELRKISNETT